MIEQKIVLIGFMFSGKTVVGEKLAKIIKLPFIDMDNEIERYKSTTIAEIFKTDGESGFRKIEKEFAHLLKNAKECVISSSGGVVIDEENIEVLKNNAIVIFLEAGKETIIKNKKSTRVIRPLLEVEDYEKKIETMLEERTPLYKKYADKTIKVDNKKVEEIVEEIQKAVNMEI